MPHRKILTLFAYAISCATVLNAQPSSSESFSRDVQPILTKNCLGCHNEKLKMSSFSIASRESMLAGGKRGPAVIPGDAEGSRMTAAIRHTGTPQMPPGRKLSDSEIRTIEQWIAGGAQWPSGSAMSLGAKPNHWSFIAPKRPAEPQVANAKWVRTSVDRFILARLEKERVVPSPEASKATLLRRAHLDLTGLPPTPEEVRAFEADKSPEAWAKVIDKLLASPHYGERWGRRWLDQARYADSDGGSRDEPRQIWRYRDWVINAFNTDMPFDRFVVEQLAGDLLPNPTKDQLTATGFHRNSLIQIEAGTDREQYRTEAVFDRADTTGTVFLGLSVGCAKCHDHKYDPVSQREYYQLYAFFNSSDDWGNTRPLFRPEMGNLHDVQGPVLIFSKPEEIAKRDEVLAEMKEVLKGTTDEDVVAGGPEIRKRLDIVRGLKNKMPALDWTLVMRELPEPRETHILLGGEYLQKGERVQPGTPSFLHSLPKQEKLNRLDLAKWIVDPANPLMARVIVNRIWQEYFGRGIVETENDFGTQASPPSHPELLDWLATEFIRSGWSQKAIHRVILNSAVYRQSSANRPDLAEKDPRNVLLARQNRLRLDAEIVRDVALAASGMLTPTVGGPSVFPPQPAAAMQASQVKKTWTPSTGPDRYRRGMYTFFWRVTPNPELVVFDAPNSMTTCTRRGRSNTPLQALTLLNDAAFHEFAQGFGLRLLREEPTDAARRLARAFQLAVARQPGAAEVERLKQFLATESDFLRSKPEEAALLLPKEVPAHVDRHELALWTSLGRVLFNTDEFITRE